VALVRRLSDALAQEVEEAREAGERGGAPRSMLDRLASLSGKARRLQQEAGLLALALDARDRPLPAPAALERRAPAAPRPRASSPSAEQGPGAGPPRATPAGLAETRTAAEAFAVALKVGGANRYEVEARLIGEFGRRDARQITDETFGALPKAAAPRPAPRFTRTDRLDLPGSRSASRSWDELEREAPGATRPAGLGRTGPD
jgi:hypothetical protein